MILNESLLESLPLRGGDAGVEGGELPEGDHLVTHAGTRVLTRLGVRVDFALAFEYPLLLLAIAFILYTRDAIQCCRAIHLCHLITRFFALCTDSR